MGSAAGDGVRIPGLPQRAPAVVIQQMVKHVLLRVRRAAFPHRAENPPMRRRVIRVSVSVRSCSSEKATTP